MTSLEEISKEEESVTTENIERAKFLYNNDHKDLAESLLSREIRRKDESISEQREFVVFLNEGRSLLSGTYGLLSGVFPEHVLAKISEGIPGAEEGFKRHQIYLQRLASQQEHLKRAYSELLGEEYEPMPKKEH
jgi:hypothetical protein